MKNIESKLMEDELIGLGWAVLEHEGNNRRESHWTLAPEGRMTSDASYFCPFRLMPLEERFHKPLECSWSFNVVDENRRMVSFIDETYGEVDSWLWDFDDDTTSTEQHPIHSFTAPGIYNVSLIVKVKAGKARHLKYQGLALE